MGVKFTVIIPLYNKEYIVDKCLASIIKQKKKPSEIILINDGSTDSSLDIALDFKRENPDFEVLIIDQDNSGVSAARNKGIAKASCENLCFLDADDEWECDFLEYMEALVLDFPDASLYCLGHKVRKKGSSCFKPKHGCSEGYRGYVDDFFRASSRGSVANSSKVCVKKDKIEEVKGFPEGVSTGEDLYVWIMLALCGKVVVHNVSCVIVNQFEDLSRSRRKNTVPYPLVFFSKKNDLLKDNKSVINYLSRIAFRHVAGSIRDGHYFEAWLRCKETKKISLKAFFSSIFLFFIPRFLLKKI